MQRSTRISEKKRWLERKSFELVRKEEKGQWCGLATCSSHSSKLIVISYDWGGIEIITERKGLRHSPSTSRMGENRWSMIFRNLSAGVCFDLLASGLCESWERQLSQINGCLCGGRHPLPLTTSRSFSRIHFPCFPFLSIHFFFF